MNEKRRLAAALPVQPQSTTPRLASRAIRHLGELARILDATGKRAEAVAARRVAEELRGEFAQASGTAAWWSR